MKKSPFRPETAFLPLSFMAIALFGSSETAVMLFSIFTSLQIISLNAPGAYRNAAASEPGIRRVDARFFGSLLQGFAGIVILLIIKCMKLIPASIPFEICFASGALLLERIFEERMYAIGRRTDAFLLTLVTFILLSAGTLIGSVCVGSTAALVIAVIVTLINQPVKRRKIMMNWSYIPRSAIRDLPCPILMCIGLKFLSISPICAFIGLTVNASCKTFARCSPDETRKPLFGICLALLITCILGCILPEFSSAAIAVAAVVSMLTGLSVDLRCITAAVLCTIICILSFIGYPLIAVALSAVALIVAFDKRMFLRKV